MQRRAAALLYGPAYHHLDHLAPLSDVMGIPLIVTEEGILEAAQTYYPRLQAQFFDYLHAAATIVEQFEVIFCCMPRPLFDEIFFFSERLRRKKVHTLWCPHGNSDKGHAAASMEALQQEEVALVYGQKMIDFMKKKQVFHSLKAHVRTGNFRYAYYQKHHAFYEALTASIPRGKPTILYAPTWKDYEHSTSFFDALPLLIERLPPAAHLIVKLHPNLRAQEELRTDRLLWKYEDRQNVTFLPDFPPVYPLLALADLYIGDFSSVGYDFLTFNRPMFFLNQPERDPQKDEGLYLYRCGVEIRPERYADIYTLIDLHLPLDALTFSKARAEVYAYTFGPEKRSEALKMEIARTYDCFDADPFFV
jgi:hypothetical protein